MTLTKRCLIAETPRAGRWNGCLLVSEGTRIDQATAVRYTSDARNRAQGRDYLMVGREVQQPTTGRKGRELLILAGIGKEALSLQQRNDLKAQLEARLNDLEELVVKTIQWDQIRQPSLIPRAELSAWLAKLSPPLDDRPLGTLRAHKKRPLIMWFGIGIVVVVLLMAFTILPGSKWLQSKSSPDDARSKSTKQPDRLLLKELTNWHEKLYPTKVDQDVEEIANQIVQALEKQLLLSDRPKTKTPPKPLARFRDLLNEFNHLSDPINHKASTPDPEKSESVQIDNPILDQGLRTRIMNVYDKKPKLNDDSVYAYFQNGEDAKKNLIRSDVSSFRQMIGKAHAVVEKVLVSEETEDERLAEINKISEIIQPVFSRVKDLQWSFFVPDDIEAMTQFKKLTNCLAANDVAKASTSSSEGGSEATLRQFIGREDNIRGGKDRGGTGKEVYEDLLALIAATKGYLASSPDSGAKE